MSGNGGWFSASPVAWIALGVTLSAHGAAFVYHQAQLAGQIGALNYQIQRNREEGLERVRTAEAQLANVYNSLSAINSIKIDVEVIKSQVNALTESMRRLERRDPTRK